LREKDEGATSKKKKNARWGNSGGCSGKLERKTGNPFRSTEAGEARKGHIDGGDKPVRDRWKVQQKPSATNTDSNFRAENQVSKTLEERTTEASADQGYSKKDKAFKKKGHEQTEAWE